MSQATSASLVTPVMAEENQAVEAVQETAVEQETTGQETTKQEAPAGEVPVEEAALVPEESTAENQENETSEATNTVDTYIEDGLYEENGEVYYYKDGEMVTNKIVEFEAEDGTTFAHYFDYDGTMLKNAYHYYVSGYDDNDDYFAGEIRVDDKGYLCTGWYSEDGYWRYYGEEDYFLCTSEIIEDNGKQYYVDSYGNMVTNTTVVKDGVTYVANSTGVLSVKDMTDKTEWVKSGEDWYLYVDGELVKENYYEYSGKTYYFDQEGCMKTGIFVDKTGKRCMAEPSGAVITNPTKGWNKSSEADIWYYINKDSSIVTDEFKEIDGKLYYFEYDGVMKTGDFSIYDSETGTSKRYYADENGKITRNDWYQAGVDWYYADANGQKETNKWIDGTYYLNELGAMVRGTCRIEGIEYFFDNNGKYIGTSAKDGWSYSDGRWFYYKDGEAYTGWVNNKYWVEDGELCTGGFIEDGGKYYYVNCEGIYQTGWIKTEENGWWGEWTYANASGEIVNDGWQSIGGNWYYLEPGMARGIEFVEYNGEYEYAFFDENGVYHKLTDGWKSIKTEEGFTDWYYVKNGKPASGYVDGYHFYGNGYLDTGIYWSDSGKVYYYDENGKMLKGTGWYLDKDDTWHYIYSDGTMATGERTIGGKKYWFTAYGDWIR